MLRANYLLTSGSVSEGHPDKVCDQISDAVFDAFLESDIKLGIADDSQVNTRLGCETLADLSPDRRLWALRPGAREGWRLLLGATMLSRWVQAFASKSPWTHRRRRIHRAAVAEHHQTLVPDSHLCQRPSGVRTPIQTSRTC